MSLITYLTRIHFADGVLEDALLEEMQRAEVFEPLLIADIDASRANAVDRVTDVLPNGDETTTLTLGAHETGSQHDFSVNTVMELGHDVVIGIGGEAALVQARATAFDACVEVITIPTTPAAIGVEPAVVTRPMAMPDAVLCDPTLFMALDRARAAQTGVDALSRAIEAYLSDVDNPPADGIALEAVRRAATSLERWVNRPGDSDARRDMMAVAINAALASRKGLGALEALSRAIDAASGKPQEHGRWHIALLPWVLAFNAPAIETRLAALEQALGVSNGDGVMPWLRALGIAVGLPETLEPLRLGKGSCTTIAKQAAAHFANRTNPRHAVTDDYLAILKAAH